MPAFVATLGLCALAVPTRAVMAAIACACQPEVTSGTYEPSKMTTTA